METRNLETRMAVQTGIAGVLAVSRRVWGLRLRRTEQELALSRLLMLPSAHFKGVDVRIASFRS